MDRESFWNEIKEQLGESANKEFLSKTTLVYEDHEKKLKIDFDPDFIECRCPWGVYYKDPSILLGTGEEWENKELIGVGRTLKKAFDDLELYTS